MLSYLPTKFRISIERYQTPSRRTIWISARLARRRSLTNHNNMDAVMLFHYGWPLPRPHNRAEMSGETDRMLAWCLQESLQCEGSFRSSGDDDSVEEAESFGTVFLSPIGIWNERHRFWTKQDLPQAAGFAHGFEATFSSIKRAGLREACTTPPPSSHLAQLATSIRRLLMRCTRARRRWRRAHALDHNPDNLHR
jgi:hypothetical protein